MDITDWLDAQGVPEAHAARDEIERLRKVADAARCIRHWHDRENGGMVVSGEHVRALWQALHDLDERPNTNVTGLPSAQTVKQPPGLDEPALRKRHSEVDGEGYPRSPATTRTRT